MSPGTIWLVVVTFHRVAELERLLIASGRQTCKLAGTVIVDNASDPAVCALAAKYHAICISSQRNLGGAGGFALGILTALSYGATLLWLWDDDGWPEYPDCLDRLVAFQAKSGAAIASPLVVDAADPALCAFAFRRGRTIILSRAEASMHEVLVGQAHLFNGALIPAVTFDRFGVPDMRLFVRGDEVDFFHRIVRGRGLVATVTAAIARHPSGMIEASPLLGGLLFAVCPADPDRARIMFRNRGYIARRHRLWRLVPLDILRYAIFFLAKRKPNWIGFGSWLSCSLDGWRGHLGSPQGTEITSGRKRRNSRIGRR